MWQHIFRPSRAEEPFPTLSPCVLIPAPNICYIISSSPLPTLIESTKDFQGTPCSSRTETTPHLFYCTPRLPGLRRAHVCCSENASWLNWAEPRNSAHLAFGSVLWLQKMLKNKNVLVGTYKKWHIDCSWHGGRHVLFSQCLNSDRGFSV
jgi:hypothetical protein